MGYKFDELDDFDEYKVTIHIVKTGDYIDGILDSELGFSSSVSLTPDMFSGMTDGFLKGVTKGVLSTPSKALGNMVSSNWKSIKTTILAYTDTGSTGFGISFHYFADRSGSYNSLLNKLYKCTQPNVDLESGHDQMVPYIHDKFDFSRILDQTDPFKGGLIHVTIGDWFFADGLFCDNLSINFSKYIDEDGKPIYCTVSMNFVPYRILNAPELASWIRR